MWSQKSEGDAVRDVTIQRISTPAEVSDAAYLDVARGLLSLGRAAECLADLRPGGGFGHRMGAVCPAVAGRVVEKAQQTAKAAEQKLAQLTASARELTPALRRAAARDRSAQEAEGSWRRDRELNTAQADANDTAKRLTAIDKPDQGAQQDAREARAIVARDRRRARVLAPTGSRATQLAALRAQLAPAAPAREEDRHPRCRDRSARGSRGARAAGGRDRDREKQLETQRRGLDQQHEDLALSRRAAAGARSRRRAVDARRRSAASRRARATRIAVREARGRRAGTDGSARQDAGRAPAGGGRWRRSTR